MNSGTVLAGDRWIEQDHHRHADDAGDRGDVAEKIEFEFVVERGVDRVRHGGEQQRVSIGRRVHDGFGADVAAGARTVLGHEGLAQPVGQPLADQARGDVDAAAGGKTGDDAHRPRRIILRFCEPREGRSGDSGAGELQE